MAQIAYNPNDPTQVSFLSALAQGETGGSSYAFSEGVGGANLTGSSTDQYGFPNWQGQGNSHAAGAFQFQPGTWATIASKFGLNFSNPNDQEAGAWYLAEQTYAQNTGGADLETALQNGTFASVQAALSKVWPSVTGNQASPQGLAGTLAAGGGANLGAATSPGGAASILAGGAQTAQGASQTAPSGIIGAVSSTFARFGLIIIGAIMVFVALWFLLSNTGYVPSPKQLAQSIW